MHLSGHWPSKRLKRKLVRRRGSRRQLKLVEKVGCEKQNKRNFLKQNVGDKIVAPTDTGGAWLLGQDSEQLSRLRFVPFQDYCELVPNYKFHVVALK